MKKAIALVVVSLSLVVASRWAFSFGANYELRDFSSVERIHVLDTTMIDEKWMLIGGGKAALAVAFLILAVILYCRDRRKVFG